MKNYLKIILISTSLISSLAWSNSYNDVLKSPTAFFREIAKAILQTQISWEEPAQNEEQLLKNTSKFLLLQNTINKQQDLNNHFGNEIKNIISNGSVLNGHELHLLGKIIGATHSLSARTLEYASLYNIENQSDPFKKMDSPSQLKRNLIWLSSHVNLFAIYRDGYEEYYRVTKIRRIVKNIIKADAKKKHKIRELGNMIAHSSSLQNRNRLRSKLMAYKKNLKSFHELAKSDKQIGALIESIEENAITNDFFQRRNSSLRTILLSTAF